MFETDTEGAGIDGLAWNPEQLPALVDDPQVGRGETIGAVVASTVMIAFIVYQQRWFRVRR